LSHSDSTLGRVVDRLDRLALLVADRPALAALVLLVGPLTVMIVVDRSSRALTTVDADELDLSPDLVPALYLRSWEADHIIVRGQVLRRGFVEHFAPPRRMSFAELIGEGTELAAPVLAIGQPGTRRLRGLGSMW